MTYKYSIIMPVYNSMNSVNTSIRSVINQTYDNWELILIDDGSTDKTLSILQEYEKKDKRIRVYHQENSGPGAARNYGITLATGNYIAFIDSDDYYENDYLELVHKKNLENEKDIIFVSTINEKKDGSFLNIDNLFQYRKKNKEELIRMQMIGIMPWGPCSKVAKTEIVKKCKFSELDVGEEAIYSFDLLEKSNSIDFIEKPLYHYVHNESGQHTKGGYDPWWNVVKNMEKKLLEIKKISKYQKSLNGLALKSLSIAIYRYACNKKYKDAKKSIKETINKYRSKYKINYIEIKEISKSLIMILILINLKMYGLLILASKIRKKSFD